LKLSVVTTLYYSSPYIEEFYRRVAQTAEKISNDFEVIFVNDGSPDDALDVVLKLYETEDRVKVVDLSRNFGHHQAIMEGLTFAKGDKIFLIDVDLEESPEWLEEFYHKMKEEGGDVVFGVQTKRKGDWFERFSGDVAYSLFNRICNIETKRNLTTARLMTRRYVNSLLGYKERAVVLSGICELAGYQQLTYEVEKLSNSRSTYNIWKKLSAVVEMITSFSTVPLKIIFYSGVTISLFTMLYSSYLAINALFFEKPLSGWTSLMISIWFLGGLSFSFMGILGAYLSKIFLEVKQRPRAIIRKVYE